MSKAIGIDLGTTNSCVSVIEGGKPVVIPNNEGARTTPSVVAFTEQGTRLVGQVAKRQAAANPENTVFSTKRLIGRRFDSDTVKMDIERAPFKIIESERGDAWIEVQGKQYSPPEISAAVLENMKGFAEDYLGEEVTQAVITVPAYFNDGQRQATRDAGKIAGLEVERIVNEPTAAALAYGLEKKDRSLIAVYDLGGGTFDISILELNNGVFNVRSTNGDTHLGGEDFDHKILDYISESFLAENDIDLRKDSMALQRVKEAAERAKHELSSSLETDINIPFIAANATGPKHLDISLTRSKIEELCLDLVERTIPPCEQALTDAGVSKDDIDDILLVGGMTRMPMVQKTVEGFFGKSGNKEVNPDEVVAIGASIQGAVLSGDIKNVILLDVTPLSLGVETAGGVFTPLIARNTTVPCKKMQVFSTALDNQPLVDIHILQGERQMAADNQKLANFELVGIPPAPRGVPQIEVSFEIDTNGIVKVSAKDLGTGKNQSMRITAQSGLSEEEVAALIQDAQNFKNEDELKRRLADAKNNAKGLIYSTKRTLDEYGDVLEAIDQDLIKTDLKKLEEALEEEDAQIIEESYKLLEESAYRIAEVLYQQGDS